jgi:hypothetical protein
MMGPFDFWTTLRSCATFEAGGGAAGGVDDPAELFSVLDGGELEQLDRMAPAEAASAARPSSRRLTKVGLMALAGAGAQVPQPVVWQLPHELDVLPMTLNGFSMALLLFEKLLGLVA